MSSRNHGRSARFSHCVSSPPLLLGRITYEELADHWFAAYVDSTPKVVVSTSLDTVDSPNESLLDGDLTEAIAELKQEPGRTIGVQPA